MAEVQHDSRPAAFSRRALELDAGKEIERITAMIRTAVLDRLHRRGAVVGVSGGIDSSVVLGLCARALGSKRVTGLLLPEKESSAESVSLARLAADRFGVQTEVEDITAALEGLGCYRRRDAAMQRVIPEYRPGWKSMIGLPGSLLDQGTLNVFSLTVFSPEGLRYTRRLPPRELAEIVAASNFKQRTRMAMLYYHAEARNYAVVGTANKNEHALGFFVKHGDGGVDVSPIAHLFKTQVYQLAGALGVPGEIQRRPAMTDTYPGGSTQEEFFYRIPFEVLDLVWYGFENRVSEVEIARALELSEEQVGRVIQDILRKQRTTQPLRMAAIEMGDLGA